jgi:hypothetical protein
VPGQKRRLTDLGTKKKKVVLDYPNRSRASEYICSIPRSQDSVCLLCYSGESQSKVSLHAALISQYSSSPRVDK